MKSEIYCISNGDYWNHTTAKTLLGAKRIASKEYQISVGGKIEVSIYDGERYEKLAVKYGYDKWQNAN